MKKHIPNFLTSLNLTIGAYGCFVVVQHPTMAIYFILASALLDFLDGFTAKILNAQSEFGKQLDSLADLVSFGVVPALAMFAFLTKPLTDPSAIVILPILIVPFSALRLARFNLSEPSDEFRGLPTPANALMISAFLVNAADFVGLYFLIGLTVVSCLLLVSNIRMIAFKFSNARIKGNELRYLLLVILIVGFIFMKWAIVPYVIPAYIGISIVGYYLIEPVLSN